MAWTRRGMSRRIERASDASASARDRGAIGIRGRRRRGGLGGLDGKGCGVRRVSRASGGGVHAPDLLVALLGLEQLDEELHTVHPPSYRYLSCQFSGWSSRFPAAATTETPRREIRILAARGAADLPRARPRGAARADTVGIVADAIVIGDANGNKPASQWTSRYASRRGSPSLSYIAGRS